MKTLVFCMACVLQCLCNEIAVNVVIQKSTIFSKIGANAELSYDIVLGSSKSINDVIIHLDTAKDGSSSLHNLAHITFQNGQPIYSYSKINATKFLHNRIKVELSNLKVTLIISDLKAEDFNRKYSCTAELEIDHTIKDIALKEATPPTIATSNLFHNNHTVTVQVGEKNLKYLCEASGVSTPSVTWDKVDYLGKFLKFKSRGLASAFLSFDTFTDEDKGGYQCTATNEGGSVSKMFFIFAGYIDYNEGALSTETVSVHLDQTVRRVCPIRGHPKITYGWYDVNKTLLELTNYYVYTPRNVEDFTNFTCEASNDFGTLYYTVVFKNADSITPTVEGVNKGNQTSSSRKDTLSMILISLLHLAYSLVLFVL